MRSKRTDYSSNISLVIEEIIRYTGCTKTILFVGYLSERLSRKVQRYGYEVAYWSDIKKPPNDAIYDRFFELIIFTDAIEDFQNNKFMAFICRVADEVIIPIPAMDFKEMSHLFSEPSSISIGYMADQGFIRDLNFNLYIGDSALVYFRRSSLPLKSIVQSYEKKLWHVQRLNHLNLEDMKIQHQIMLETARRLETQINQVKPEKALRNKIIPHDSRREYYFFLIRRGFEYIRNHGIREFLRRLRFKLKMKFPSVKAYYNTKTIPDQILQLETQRRPSVVISHQKVDVIVCVHNALDDVKQCLSSISKHTSQPFSLIIIDDGSDLETKDFLCRYCNNQNNIKLHRNEHALGYTYSANIGMRLSEADYLVLLNSDTLVTPQWLDRMITCAGSDPKIGVVGPLSNTASWQSVPEILNNGDWAMNPIPKNISVEEFGKAISEHSGRIFPEMPLLNGFCLMIKKELINDIGFFDEENFGAGYGEEDDFNLRARKAGWKLALADDVYIFHSQSRSYSNEKRKLLVNQSGQKLIQKHGYENIQEGVDYCRNNRVLQGIRFFSKFVSEKEDCIREGKIKHNGRKILFLLPVTLPGGGANCIFNEAISMQKMGVQVDFFNLNEFRFYFEKAYPKLPFEVRYGERGGVPLIANEYDAVIATVNHSVQWLNGIQQQIDYPKLGYYIQGFEPLIFSPKTEAYRIAMKSYSYFPNLIRFCKTNWTRVQIQKNCGVETSQMGISVDTQLFRPFPRQLPFGSIRIMAMVRPETQYREPEKTMLLLQNAWKKYGKRIEIFIFGTTVEDPCFLKLPRDFVFHLMGILHPSKVAILLNEGDIFVDYSSHQAMGLTALEAMACGNAVIVPQHGGAVEFAINEKNAIVADTSSFDNVWASLQKLIEDEDLRSRIKLQAMQDVCQYYPEKPALNILNLLFEGN